MTLKQTKKEEQTKKEKDLFAQLEELFEKGKKGWSAKELQALAALAQGKTRARINIQPSIDALRTTYDLVAGLDAAVKGNKHILDRWG